MRTLKLAGAALCVALAHAPALAAPPAAPPAQTGAEAPQSADPAKIFERGRSLWEARDFASALPLFEQALKASGSPNARLYVARCLRDLGRLPEAHAQMSQTVHDAMALAKKEARYVQTRDTAAAELALLEQRVGKVVVVLPESLAGAKVLVNGSEVPPEHLSQPVAVTPGPVTVVAIDAKGSSTEREITVGAGRMLSVTLDAPGAVPSPSPEPPTTAPVAEDDGEGFGAVRAAGIGVAAVGVAGFVVFGIGRAQADDEIATLEQDCGPGPCTDPAYADVVDRGKTAETMAAIGLGVGIAGVLAGTAMIIFGGDDGAAAESAWAPTPNGLRFRF